MQIFIKQLSGRTITLDVEPDTLVSDLVVMAYNKRHEEQREATLNNYLRAITFVRAGVTLDGRKKLSEYGIVKESTVHEIPRRIISLPAFNWKTLSIDGFDILPPGFKAAVINRMDNELGMTVEEPSMAELVRRFAIQVCKTLGPELLETEVLQRDLLYIERSRKELVSLTETFRVANDLALIKPEVKVAMRAKPESVFRTVMALVEINSYGGLPKEERAPLPARTRSPGANGSGNSSERFKERSKLFFGIAGWFQVVGTVLMIIALASSISVLTSIASTLMGVGILFLGVHIYYKCKSQQASPAQVPVISNAPGITGNPETQSLVAAHNTKAKSADLRPAPLATDERAVPAGAYLAPTMR